MEKQLAEEQKMFLNEWIPLEKQHPPDGHEVALLCVRGNGDVAHALGWLTKDGEWSITAFPVGVTPLSISHWCELPNNTSTYTRADPWPSIKAAGFEWGLQVNRNRTE